MSANFTEQQFQKRQFKHSKADLQEKNYDYEGIRKRLKLPAYGLILSGVFSLVVVIGTTVSTVTMGAVRSEEIQAYWVEQLFGPQPSLETRRNVQVSKRQKEIQKQRQSQAQMVVTVGVGLVIIGGVLLSALYLMAITAGVLMLQIRNYNMAKLGCIVAMIPLISPLVVLGVPFAIWGLIKINHPDIRPAFR